MKDLAPIVLFVYNRPEHTKSTVEALAKNDLFSESVVYIFADGAKDNADEVQLDKIQEVREYCKAIKGCKKLVIEEAPKNKGLAKSVIYGVTTVINLHGKAIVLEDDIITAKSFLNYMNKGLELYEAESQVGGITSHSFTTNSELDDTYFLPITSSWGWATWKRVWDKVNFDATSLLKSIDDNELKDKLNFGSYPYYEMLLSQVEGKVDSWAIRFYASLFIQKKIFLFSRLPVSTNIGFDSSGTHCADKNYFSTNTELNDKASIYEIRVELIDKNIHTIENHFKIQVETMKTSSNENSNFIKKVKLFIKNKIGY